MIKSFWIIVRLISFAVAWSTSEYIWVRVDIYHICLFRVNISYVTHLNHDTKLYKYIYIYIYIYIYTSCICIYECMTWTHCDHTACIGLGQRLIDPHPLHSLGKLSLLEKRESRQLLLFPVQNSLLCMANRCTIKHISSSVPIYFHI